MQTELSQLPKLPNLVVAHSQRNYSPSHHPSSFIVTGVKQKVIQSLIWINILFLFIISSGNIVTGFKKALQLRQLRNRYRNNFTLKKYRKINSKYYSNYNAPGWPSKSFNRYINHLSNKMLPGKPVTLHTVVFAITKKCGFKCEHCCEWENLNQPEVLEKEDLLQIVSSFYLMGISQLQISGGEPLNRFNDILFLLEHIPAGIDSWIYTTGYQLTPQKAQALKQHGLTGITISIDDYDALKHDRFRGKPGAFLRAINACSFAVEAGLVVTFSICATRQFITEDNLMAYAELARKHGATFIQILEPKAVGHYSGKDVTLTQPQILLLEQFFEKMNYSEAYLSYPLVAYHGYYSRKIGCAGGGKDYLYIDTDGDIHNCPFCQRKLFSALSDLLPEKIRQMRNGGCAVFS
ncbi:MAG: radical SAM protein [Ferruginibacter sp.]